MSLGGTNVSRVRARLGSKGDCVLKCTYLAGDPFLPTPRSNEVHCQAASESDGKWRGLWFKWAN